MTVGKALLELLQAFRVNPGDADVPPPRVVKFIANVLIGRQPIPSDELADPPEVTEEEYLRIRVNMAGMASILAHSMESQLSKEMAISLNLGYALARLPPEVFETLADYLTIEPLPAEGGWMTITEAP